MQDLPEMPVDLVHAQRAQSTTERMLVIHKWFEVHAARSPHAIALTFEGENFTYGRLNEQANRIAHRLGDLGVGRNVIVGLIVERSPSMVIAILGILKAGAAYLPVDPSYPQNRQSFLLADANVPVLLTQRHLLPRLPKHQAHVELLDETDKLPSRTENPQNETQPEDFAYVIYTSGSSGLPKGVVVTHANVARLLEATDPWFRFDNRDTWTLFHSISFDFSVWELWGALAFGGRLVIVPYLVSRSPEDFYRLLRDEQVTVLNQTPSAFRQLIRAEETLGGCADDLALRLVVFGGETLMPSGLRPWFDRHGDRFPLLVNMYGITETTVHVTYRPLSTADLAVGAPASPIGRPIPDLQIHLLDDNFQPVSDGLPGEMFVGGAGVARGYLNRDELTAARFVADPFSNDLGARLYRSGDLARRLPNGELEFLGRADNQVKIRGFRIEVAEIEASLARCPELRESVVVAREDSTGQNRLIAYVTGTGEIDGQALRRKIGEELPDYMIPSLIVPLDTLPLNANGKVDRSALATRALVGLEHTGNGSSLSDSTERQVAAIWSGILGCAVRLDDNFFDLGGTSVDLVEVHARLRDHIAQDLSVIEMFDYPTVRALTARLAGPIGVRQDLQRERDRAKSQRDSLARKRRAREVRP
jgi:amino acid adenylation domain-containing protein